MQLLIRVLLHSIIAMEKSIQTIYTLENQMVGLSLWLQTLIKRQ